MGGGDCGGAETLRGEVSLAAMETNPQCRMPISLFAHTYTDQWFKHTRGVPLFIKGWMETDKGDFDKGAYIQYVALKKMVK